MSHPIIPIYRCWFSICTAEDIVKQSTYSHWNRPWTVSQSKYIQRQFEFRPIWGPKMAHKFDPWGLSFTHLTVPPMNL